MAGTTFAEPVAAPALMPAGLPLGRRSPRGRLRWYLARVPEGRESATCARLRRILPAEVLEDAFELRKERWFRRGGVWSLQSVPAWSGYVFLASRDAAALDRALLSLSFPVRLAGGDGAHAFAPLSEGARGWLESAMDPSHVLRNSTAEIVGGELHVLSGPLVGREALVRRVDRHRRVCLVSVPDARGAFSQSMPLDVPVKR